MTPSLLCPSAKGRKNSPSYKGANNILFSFVDLYLCRFHGDVLSDDLILI